MKYEHTVSPIRANRDPRAPVYFPEESEWDRLLEEHRKRALDPSHPWKNAHYLALALVLCAAVLGVVGVVLWP